MVVRVAPCERTELHSVAENRRNIKKQPSGMLTECRRIPEYQLLSSMAGGRAAEDQAHTVDRISNRSYVNNYGKLVFKRTIAAAISSAHKDG